MSLLSENIIPGNHGKIFGTDAMEENDLIEIKTSLLTLEESMKLFSTLKFS
jgi:hypothetical protein